MYPINQFKYAVLLADLNSIKGSKGPIDKFIKRIYEGTNNLSSIDHESMRYCFMLVTRAIAYSSAIHPCKDAIKRRIRDVAEILINSEVIIPANILETYEFWFEDLVFRPSNLSNLERIDSLLRTVSQKPTVKYNCYMWNVFEVRHLESIKRDFAIRMFIPCKFGADSPLLKALGLTPIGYDPTLLIASLEETVNNLQIILKESYEYVSLNSSTTVQ